MTMKKIFLLVTAMAMVACVKDATENVAVKPAMAESKIIMSDTEYARGQMIVCFDEEAIKCVESGVSRSGGTRSGVADFDALLGDIAVESLERLFPLDVRHEERARAAGLHRWYLVRFDECADLKEVARRMAEVAEVSTVQYNSIAKRVSEVKVEDTLGAKQSAAPVVAPATRNYEAFNDPELHLQWHLINTGDKSIYSGAKVGADVNCLEAWPITAGDPRVVVAIVDDYVKYDHPDLQANMWINEKEKNGRPDFDDDQNGFVDDIHGFNFVTSDEIAPSPENDHGTHVAGIVAAVNNNGVGVCGVAGGTGNGDGARLMACQVFYDDHKNSATDAVCAKAFYYAANNGAVIAQCSFGLGSKYTSDRAYANGSAEKLAIDYFLAAKNCDAIDGGIIIFAAGNESWNYSSYPGAYRDYISVTAMSCDFTPAYYTNYGRGTNIAAPGGDHLQGYWDDYMNGTGGGHWRSGIHSTTYVSAVYDSMQGTSMACPCVSGVAALGLSHALAIGKTFTVKEYKALLLTSVNDINRYCTGEKYKNSSPRPILFDVAMYRGVVGTGYIDAFQVLMNVEGTPCIPVPVGTKKAVDLSQVLGGGVGSYTFIDGGVEMSQADRTKLGVEGTISISSSGKLSIKCTKPGSAIVTLRFIAGGDRVGTDEATGGMEVEKKVAIVARGFASNGGWL